MTISNETFRVTYSGDGSTTNFSYTFRIIKDTQLAVSVVTDATGASVTQVLNTDYTVSGEGNLNGGTVVMTSAPAAGETLVIKRDTPFKQETDYTERDALPAETLENDLDLAVMRDQELLDKINRAVVAGDIGGAASGEIPSTDMTYKNILRVNSAGTGFEAKDFTTVMAEVSNMTALGAAADSADTLILYDNSASAAKKVTVANLISGAVGDPDQNLWETIAGDSGSAAASTTTDTFTIAGGTEIGTSVSGSTLTINAEFTPSSTDTLTNKTFDANATGNSLSNVDVADLASGTDGELITWDASGNPTTIAVGTSGHILTSNGAGAAPTFQAAAGGGGGLVHLSTTTIGTAETSWDFDSVFSSTYDCYLITVSGAGENDNASGGTFFLSARLSSDGGTTYRSSSAYGRYYAYTRDNSTSPTNLDVNNAGANAANEMVIGKGSNYDALTDASLKLMSCNTAFWVHNPSSTTVSTLLHGQCGFGANDGTVSVEDIPRHMLFTGSSNTAVADDSIQISTTSASITFDYGVISIYGLAKS